MASFFHLLFYYKCQHLCFLNLVFSYLRFWLSGAMKYSISMCHVTNVYSSAFAHWLTCTTARDNVEFLNFSTINSDGDITCQFHTTDIDVCVAQCILKTNFTTSGVQRIFQDVSTAASCSQGGTDLQNCDIIIIILYGCLLSQAFLPGTSLEPAVIPTARASSFTLQYFPYYV